VHTWDLLKDGRLVCSSELPTGIYTVCIEGFGPETITRRVVLLDE